MTKLEVFTFQRQVFETISEGSRLNDANDNFFKLLILLILKPITIG